MWPNKTSEMNKPSCEKQQFVAQAPLDHQWELLHSVTENAKRKKWTVLNNSEEDNISNKSSKV